MVKDDQDNAARYQGRFCGGFTLMELLIGLAVMFFLLTVALPSFSSFVEQAEIDSRSHTLYSLLSQARTSAIVEGERMVICRWDGANGCTGHSARGTLLWSQGALLFNDLNENRQLDMGSESVSRISRFDDAVAVTWNRGETVVYEADGTLLGGSNGRFTLQTDNETAEIILSLTGRVRRTGL